MSWSNTSNLNCLYNNSNTYKFLLFVLVLIFAPVISQAATYYSRANAAWNVASTWSTVGYGGAAATSFPVAGDIVFIGNGYTVTASGANVAFASLTIDAGGVFNPSGARTVTASTGITINGTYTNQSTGAITTPSWICNGTYNHATSFRTLPRGTTTSIWAPTSNCNITGSYTTATQFANFIGQTFGNFTFNPSAMTATVCMYGDKSGTVTVQGNFTVVNTGSNVLFLRQVGYAFVGELNINGNFTMNAGTLDLHNGGTTPTSSVVNLKGNLSLSCSSTLRQTTTQSGSFVKFNFTGTSVQNVDICSTTSITSQATTPSCAIQFIVASGSTINMGTSVLTGTNNTSFTLSSGAGIITAHSGGISTSGASGSIQVAGARTYSTTANYTYNGTAAQVTGNGLTGANNLTISNTNAAGVTFSNAIDVSGTLNITTGSKANLGTFTSKASTVVLGGVTMPGGNAYGGTGAPQNVIINTTYFIANSGQLNVSLPAPTNLSYNSPFSFRLNTTIPQQNPTVTGIVDSYSISQPLPTGLNFNTSTGAITGTPTVNSPSTIYTVTATNSAGSTSCQIVISVGNYFYAVNNGNWNTGIWAPTSGGTADGKIPESGDIVFIGEGTNNYTVTIPSGYAAVCGSLTMGTFSDNTVAVLNFTDATSSLTVGNDLVMNRPNAAATTAINVNAGKLSVGGTLKLSNADLTPDANTSLVNQVNISTGTVTTKNLHFNGQSAPQSQVIFSGAGTLNISGDVTFGYLLGTLTPSTGKVNFNGTVAQSIPIGVSAVTYNNLSINNTSAAGATLSNAAITASNVTGNLLVGDINTGSTFDNGGFAITLASGKTFTVANGSTFKLSGTSTMTTAPGGKTFGPTSTVNYSGSAQTVTSETYGNLILSGSGIKTMPSATTTVAGNFTISGTASATALAAVNTAGNFTIGSGATFNASSFTHTVGANWENSGTFVHSTSTIDFNGSGAGNIGSSNFNNVTFSGSGTKTATGTLIISGNVNISNNFAGGLYAHTVAGNWTNSGTFTPSTGSIIFNGTTAQTVNNGSSSFNNFTLNNTGGTITAASAITVSDVFTTRVGTVMDMSTFPLSIENVNHSGTLLTQNTSTTPISSGKTWGGTVNYNSSSSQTAVAGTYNNLTISTPGGAKAGGDITVNGVLNLQAENPNETNGTLEMTKDYGDYSNIITPTNLLTSTYLQAHDLLDSWILYMGERSTTIGPGDVTGKIKRTELFENVEYSFGNQNSTIILNKNNTGVLPSAMMFIVTKGNDRGIHANKTDAVARLYQVIRTGGSLPTTFSIKLHYGEGELNGNTENKLVLWDHHIPYSSENTPHEHGKSAHNTTENWLSLLGHGINYLTGDAQIGSPGKYWMISNTLLTGNTWLGAVYGDETNWNNPSNWSAGHVPNSNDNVIIPVVAYYPVLPSNATAKSITIETGATLNGGSGTLTLYGGISSNGGIGSWNNNGTFNPGTSTVIFNFPRTTNVETSTIAGAANFYNITLSTNTNLIVQSGANLSIGGDFISNGSLFAAMYNNTISYNGANQIIAAPVDDKYCNLTLEGSGTKTLPASLTVNNNFTLGGTASIASGSTITLLGENFVNNSSGSIGGTIVLSGTDQQTISGTAPATFSDLTVNNANGVLLENSITVNGNLTLTNGVVTTEDNILTIGCSGNIIGANTSKYIVGKLARIYCDQTTKEFPIGKGGYYRPMTLTYSSPTSVTVHAEVFESSTIIGTLPAFTFLLSPSRYWEVTETTTTGKTFNITLDGTDYPVLENPVVLNDYTTNPLANYPATVSGNNYTASGLSHFGNFQIAAKAPSTVTWVGTTNNDWNEATNWNNGYIYTSYDKVIIPSGLSRYPALSTEISSTELTLQPGAQLTLNTGGKITTTTLTLESDATYGPATLLDNEGGITASVVNVKHPLTSGRNWYVSSPVSAAKSTVFNASSSFPMYWYKESTGSTNPWISITNGDSTMVIMKGYIANIQNTADINFTGGTLNTGNLSITLRRTAGQTKEGFNLIGNPYPSYLNIESIKLNNDIEPTYWYRSRNAANSAWIFDTYNITSGIGTGLSGKSVTNYIPPIQAFWIRVKSGSSPAILSFDNSMRGHRDMTNNVFRAPKENSVNKVLRLKVSNDLNEDETVVYFNENAANAYDAYDSPKMSNENAALPEIYTVVGNEQLAINGYNSLENISIVPLGFRTGLANNYSIEASEISNFKSGTKIFLRDNVQNYEQELTLGTKFNFYSDKTNSTSRFSLIFKAPNVPNAVDQTGYNEVEVWINPENGNITVKNPNFPNNKSTIAVYNAIGQKLYQQPLISTYTTIDKKFVTGVYMVTVESETQVVSRKIVLK